MAEKNVKEITLGLLVPSESSDLKPQLVRWKLNGNLRLAQRIFHYFPSQGANFVRCV